MWPHVSSVTYVEEYGHRTYNLEAHKALITQRAQRLMALHLAHRNPHTVQFCGAPLEVFPEVFCPAYGEGSQLLAECLSVTGDDTVLDMGTGSGALAILAAKQAQRVVGTDISPIAVACAATNVVTLDLSKQVDIRQGDLFASIEAREKFSLVFFNPPFMEGGATSWLERAMYDPAYDTLARFIQGVGGYLTDNGRVLIAFSTCGDVEYLNAIVRKAGMRSRMVKTCGHDLEFYVYELRTIN